VTVFVPSNAPSGTYSVTITGFNGVSHSVTIPVTVGAAEARPRQRS
jgi:hypothetical protein